MRWRPVIGFKGRYEISDYGDVRTLTKNAPEHGLMRLQLHHRGYLRVKLYKSNGKRLWRRVHRMVAESFIGPRPSKEHTVDHKDFCKRNNYYENLEWVTREENYQRWLEHEKANR